MKAIRKLTLLAAAALAILASQSAKADYSNSVMALNPVAYWPLNETNVPPDTIGTATALNLGTVGAALDAPFNTVNMVHGYPGALASTTDTANSFNGFNTRAQSPYTPDLANAPSFTIEAWLLAHDDGTLWSTTCPLSDVGANSPRTGWLIYMDISNIGQYTFRTYNANGTAASLSLDIGAPGSIQNEKWYHVAVVVSNAVTVTNVYAYLNGTLVAGPVVLPGYVPCDGTTGGFSIGDRSDNAGFNYVGAIDEVAYYTNALDAATVLSHYQAGTNPSPVTAYSTLVQQQKPIIYYRMNEVPTPRSSPYILPLPVATNYGSFGSSLNGFYQPGTAPGVAGPTNSAFGANSRACQFSPFGGHSSSENGPGVMCAPYNQAALNLNQAVSLLAWIQVPSTPTWFQTPIGRGDTSYRIDVDPSAMPHFAANPNGEPIGAVPLADNLWHLWAGVFDPIAGKDLLYIDGALAAEAAGSSALVNMSTYLMIGGAPDYNDRNFVGNIAHVAIFSNALSQAQIQTLYNSVGAPPIVLMPTNQFFLDENSTGGITASASGTPPVSFQWYSTDLGTTNLLAGQTSLTLTLNNVSVSQDGLLYFMVASNVQGVATGNWAKLTVLSGPPTISRDLPAFEQVPVGVPVTYSVSATGTEPFHYQWFKNGSTAIAGATSSSLTVNALAGTNTYSVTVTNVNGSVNSAVSTLVGLTSAPPVVSFSGNGNGWTFNTVGVPTGGFSGDVLTLTDGSNDERSSAFYNTPQYIGGFVAFFTYYETNGSAPLADGASFAIQNSAAGVNALGNGGGQLGFGGIENSAAFEMNLYPPSSGGVGIQFATGGLTPTTTPGAAPYFSTAPVSVASGNPINVRLFYNQGTLAVQLVDTVSNSTYRTTLNVGSIPNAVNGGSALVGFTGATGGLNSIQKISNFRFAYTTPPILAVNNAGANVLITWPVSVSTLFVLQQSSSVTGPWANVGTAPTIVNGQNQISAPNSGAKFYRLILQ